MPHRVGRSISRCPARYANARHGWRTDRPRHQERSAVKDVKIIILTSMGQRGDAARLEALGCSGYLLKPVKQQMLFDAVVAVLDRKEEQPRSSRAISSEKSEKRPAHSAG